MLIINIHFQIKKRYEIFAPLFAVRQCVRGELRNHERTHPLHEGGDDRAKNVYRQH